MLVRMFPCFLTESRIIYSEDIYKIFNEFGSIIHKKDIYITENAAVELTKISYEGKAWLGSKHNNFWGARKKVKERFIYQEKNGLFKITALLFACENLKTADMCKATIRELVNYGKSPIHVTDTQEEAIVLAEILFSKKGLAKLTKTKKLH